MRNKIIDYLQWTSHEYDQRFFKAYWNWCQLHASSPSQVQQFLACASINKWFCIQYSLLEENFVKIAEIMPNNTKQLVTHYETCTADISSIYPADLISSIKRNADFSNAIITNTPIFYAN